jgi:Gpi18-like mannosyltransferase
MTLKRKVNYFFLQKTIWFTIIVLGIILKFILAPVKTGDYVGFLNPWIIFIKTHGYASSLKYNFYDYTPSYIYVLIIIAKTGLNPLYLIKFISILFEYLAAFFVGKIVNLKYHSTKIFFISFAVLPLLPTVILNSSYLSQCDSIYASFILGSIYFILKNKQILSVIFLGLAFAFKMQTVFILPLFFVFMLRGKINWYYFFIIPLIFILSILPPWFYGRELTGLLKVYLNQTDHYRLLTLNFPNLYIWIDNDFYEPVKTAGIVATIIITLLSGFWLSKKKYVLSFEMYIKLAFLSSIFIPFILPGMHERYMYLGDLLGVLYYLVLRKNIHLPISILLVSFYSYIRCSRYNEILPMSPAFFVYLAVIVLTSIDFITGLKVESNEI